jgi:hypothetical protein
VAYDYNIGRVISKIDPGLVSDSEIEFIDSAVDREERWNAAVPSIIGQLPTLRDVLESQMMLELRTALNKP